MDVRLRDVRNGQVLLSRVLRVLIEIPHGIDHDSLALRRENVGILGQPCHFELLDLHRLAFL